MVRVNHLTDLFTAHEGIAGHARGTATEGSMVDHITQGVEAACARTRIPTLHVLTSLIGSTIRVGNTLRTTLGWTTYIILQAGADCGLLHYATL